MDSDKQNAPKPRKLSVYTLGCRVNHFESLALEDAAKDAGYEVVKWGEPADAAIVNSCALTVLAEAKTRQAVRTFARNNPNSPIAITGCYAQTAPSALADIANVKWIVGNRAKTSIIKIMEAFSQSDGARIFLDPPARAERLLSQSGQILDRTNLKIQDGCDNACSYCIIPRARGKSHSRDFDSVVADAETLVSRGVREIILTGINLGKFFSPKGGLAELVDKLDKIPELLRIRMGSMEPMEYDLDGLFERMADSSHKLSAHIHLSAQSMSDNVLKIMRRKYRARDFANLVKTARSKVPDISIGADIICGHPGETVQDFNDTKAALADCALAYIHVFTFSPRSQTLAATMSEITPPKPERKARADELREFAARAESEFIKSQIGKIRPVLLENRLSNGDYLGYTDNYLQVAVNIPRDGLRNTMRNLLLTSPEGAARVRAQIFDTESI